MDIWKGALLGDLYKHRDYEHASFGEHAFENGMVLWFLGIDSEEVEEVPEDDELEDELEEEEREALIEADRARAKRLLEFYFERDPATGLQHENPKLYYALMVRMETKFGTQDYEYYIPAPENGGLPDKQLIMETLDKYIANKYG